MAKRLRLSVFMLLIFTALQAQDESKILLKSTVFDQKVYVNWFPTDAETWEALTRSGVNLSRQALDASGNPTGSPEKLNAAPILPKDSTWFRVQKEQKNVVLDAIGRLMYDTTFQFPKTDLLDPVAMKYNYSVYEAERDPLVAAGLGLLFIDETAEAETTYRYTVTSVDASIISETATMDLLVKNLGFATNMPEKIIQYEFPGDKPLSDLVIGKEEVKPFAILATAKAYGDSIVLRWAPNQALLWQKANEDGYEITRVNLKDIKGSKKTFSVFPIPVDSIPLTIEKDSFAMLAAGIMYGTAELPATHGFYDKANIFESKFGFGLYTAERSVLAAEILGLRYVDEDVQPGEKYVYFVSTKETPGATNQGYIEIENIKTEMPTVAGFIAKSEEKRVRLEWLKSNENTFNSYLIERSEDDGKTYQPMTGKPLVFIEREDMKLTNFNFVDSVGVNYKKFKYRIAGYNAFNEICDFEQVEGQGVDLTPPEKVIFNGPVFKDTINEFHITWKEDYAGVPEDFKAYQVLMSDEEEGFYDAISEELPAGTTSYVLKMGEKMNVNRAYYFKVVAMDKNGNNNETLGKFADVPDLIAPDPPTNLVGKIDDEGKVELSWDASASEDTKGYWVYFNNNPKTEFSPVNTKLLKQTSYSYYVEKKSLNEDIYFTVRAEDGRNNRGKTAGTIKVKRPDHIPPVKPFITGIAVEKSNLVVKWNPSPSNDVVKQMLWRRNLSSTDTAYVLVDSLDASMNQYKDSGMKIGESHRYKISVVDDAGNLSTFSNNATSKLSFPAAEIVVDFKLKSETAEDQKVNLLSWEFAMPYEELKTRPYTFDIYRAAGGKEPNFLASVKSNESNYSDVDVIESVLYNYSIKVRFKNGWVGEMSNTKSVLVK